MLPVVEDYFDEEDGDDLQTLSHEAAFTAASNRRDEYTDYVNTSIFVGTFNVNGQYPSQDLKPWLCPLNNAGKAIDPPDIYAVGFQELDLSQQAYMYDLFDRAGENERQDKWLYAVEQALHPAGRYVKLHTTRLVGILVAVYVKSSLFEQGLVTECAYCSVPTGIMNRMGNKGGCAIRVKIRDSTFCFVTSHLAAHFTEYSKRNQDFHSIRSGTRFTLVNGGAGCEIISMLDHDVIFWFGDLNYRLQTAPGEQPEITKVKEIILVDQLADLRCFDQLRLAQSDGSAFEEFTEGGPGHPVFKPTYKYDVSTDNFDSSEKNRIPAWTDRILYGGSDSNHCVLQAYNSAPEIKMSDHKPVYALYAVKVRSEDQVKKNKVYNEEFKNIDKKLNELQPKVKVSTLTVDFGEIGYGDVICKTLTLENIGKVNARFLFKSPSGPTLAPWLTACPMSAKVQPQSSLVVELSCDMQSCKSVYDLHANGAAKPAGATAQLESHIILIVRGGSHIFVTVRATYVYSSFGQKLSDLKCVGDLQRVEPAPLIDLGDGPTQAEFLTSTTPKETPLVIARLVHHIKKYGAEYPKLLNNAPLSSEYPELRKMLSDDSNFVEKLPFTIHTVALALPTFLGSLRDPIVPYELYDTIAPKLKQPAFLNLIVNEQLPPQNFEILKFLVAYFKALSGRANLNHATVDLVSVTFGPSILRKRPVDTAPPPPAPKAAPVPPPRKKKETAQFFDTRSMSMAEDSAREEADRQTGVGSEFLKFLLVEWVWFG